MRETNSNRRLWQIGLALTVAYLGLIAWWRWSDLGTLTSMELNEFGDFWAGVLGPVAFLWLVLGFMQQGIELRQNTEALENQGQALHQQVEKLKESVDEQHDQAEAMRELAAVERAAIQQRRDELAAAALPRIVVRECKIESSGPNGLALECTLRNIGAPATYLQLILPAGAVTNSPGARAYIDGERDLKFNWSHRALQQDEGAKFSIDVKYRTLSGEAREGRFHFRKGRHSLFEVCEVTDEHAKPEMEPRSPNES